MRHAPVALAATALVLAATALFAAVALVDRVQEQRSEAVYLLCEVERILEEFVRAGPDLPRDDDALRELERLDCDDLVQDLKPPP